MPLFYIICICILFGAFLISTFYRTNRSKRNNSKVKQRFNLVDWMKMTREERKLYDDNEKRKFMQRKQLLLNQIRKEYKDLSKTKR